MFEWKEYYTYSDMRGEIRGERERWSGNGRTSQWALTETALRRATAILGADFTALPMKALQDEQRGRRDLRRLWRRG